MFEAERDSFIPYAGPFDGFHAVTASVSKTCLVRFDSNKYSVVAHAVGRPVELQAYVDRVEIRQDGKIVGEHVRSFGRNQTIYDPWHYVPVLARKPGAWRNGAPFKHWVLPTGMEQIRRKLAGSADGDHQMVSILTAVLQDGLEAVEEPSRHRPTTFASHNRRNNMLTKIIGKRSGHQMLASTPASILNHKPDRMGIRIDSTNR